VGENPESTDPIVQQLLNDARLISTYSDQAGLSKDQSLHAAIAAAEQLQDKKLWSPEFGVLRTQLNNAMSLVPFSTLVALRNGWRPGAENQRPWFSLLALSVIMMIVAGHLSQVYNEGVNLLAEIKVLSVSHPDRRFGQLSRQLLSARKEIANGTNVADASGGKPLDLQAYFQIYDDLHELDAELFRISNSAKAYSDSATFPIFGMKKSLYLYYSLLKRFNIADSDTIKWLQTQDSAFPTYSNYASSSAALSSSDSFFESFKKYFGGVAPAAQGGGASGVQNSDDSSCPQRAGFEQALDSQLKFIDGSMKYPPFASVVKEYFYANIYNNCYEYINFGPYNTPSMDYLQASVNDLVTPYAMWILPGLYGAIGALIFHLRMILDPLIPNPSRSRIAHRVVLGALSGMVLAWFWVPETRFGAELTGIGFSLFALCFIFGFSLDIFFAMLDKFVKISVAAVGQLGADQVKTN